ncbi:MAG: DUF4124 domain-containing protein, partial [Enterobacterales bacterium]|nr:DUF4124 domain-containing protein [Enterobacterales bacterium]
MRCLKLILLILLPFIITDISAKIFICVDEQGKRHYSDKRCPTTSGKVSQSYAMTNRVVAPQNVITYSAVLKLARESLALLMILEPNDSTYINLYDDVSTAQRRHSNFINNPDRRRFRGYNPLGLASQNRLIAGLSSACREQGHMSICGAIEGNSWFSSQATDFFKISNQSQ